MSINDHNIAFQKKWVRVTQNPKDTAIVTGDKLTLKGHPMLNDGVYYVTMVEEFETEYIEKERDLRVTLVNTSGYSVPGVNFQNVLKHRVKEDQQCSVCTLFYTPSNTYLLTSNEFTVSGAVCYQCLQSYLASLKTLRMTASVCSRSETAQGTLIVRRDA